MNKHFKLFISLFSILLLSSFSVFGQGKIKFSTTDIYNNQVTDLVFAYADVNMINIWGTFCGPCINEMPDLGKLSKEYSSKDLQIIGIVIDVTDRKGNPDAKKISLAQSIVEKTNANYLHLVANNEMNADFLSDVYAVPTTIFTDSRGRIIGKTYTGSRDYKSWKKIIDSMIE